MEPSELYEAQDQFDADMDKAEKRRIWVENRALQIRNDDFSWTGMAYEVDAIYMLGHILCLLHSKSMFELDEYVRTEALKYCFQIAEREADEHGRR
jgi:hypothetical protein